MNRTTWVLGLLFLSAVVAAPGCKKDAAEPGRKPAGAAAPPAGTARFDEARFAEKPEQQADAKQAQAAGERKKEAPIERKVIYTASIQLTVADVGKAEGELDQLVRASKGYVANSDVSGTAGGSRQGTWKVRIPVARFHDFREGVKKLGELARYSSDANDVTAEFYDLETRIKNKEATADELRKLMAKAAGNLEELLRIRKELEAVTDDLERIKARHHVLANLAEMTTISITLQERGTFQPPESPSFGTLIDRTFSGSLEVLTWCGKAIVLIAVALGPWLPVLAVLLIPAWLVYRRVRTMLADTPKMKGPASGPEGGQPGPAAPPA
jgi:hypothetical protein